MQALNCELGAEEYSVKTLVARVERVPYVMGSAPSVAGYQLYEFKIRVFIIV